MCKSKCGVKVLSSSGASWTTRRGARRMVNRGIAVHIDASTVAMIEDDHRYLCLPNRPWADPMAELTVRQPEFLMDSGLNCFALPWPLKDQSTRGRRIAA